MIEFDTTVSTLITGLTVVATATMAITGVLQAYRHNFDPLGAGALALITAVGGGTLRDLLLGSTPVFWITDLIYVGTVLPVVFIGVFTVRHLKAGSGRRERLLNYIDAIGLALFTIVGVQKALSMDTPAIIAIILGCVTGIAGGMIRDLLCNEQPVVLREDLYATLALLGGGLFILLRQFFEIEVSSLIAFLFIVSSRFWVIARGISSRPLSKF